MKWLGLLSGIFLIIAGGIMFATPVADLLLIAWILSLSMLISGISEIAHFFGDKEKRSILQLMSGVLSTLVGLWVFVGKGTIGDIAIILPFIFGFWLVATGSLRVGLGYSLKNVNKKGGTTVIVLGVISMAYGFLVMFNPLFGFLSISTLVSLVFILQGVALAGSSFAASKKEKAE